MFFFYSRLVLLRRTPRRCSAFDGNECGLQGGVCPPTPGSHARTYDLDIDWPSLIRPRRFCCVVPVAWCLWGGVECGAVERREEERRGKETGEMGVVMVFFTRTRMEYRVACMNLMWVFTF